MSYLCYELCDIVNYTSTVCLVTLVLLTMTIADIQLHLKCSSKLNLRLPPRVFIKMGSKGSYLINWGEEYFCKRVKNCSPLKTKFMWLISYLNLFFDLPWLLTYSSSRATRRNEEQASRSEVFVLSILCRLELVITTRLDRTLLTL